MIKLFITATDTDAGKTLIASALAHKLSKEHKVAVFKPVSAGCEIINGELINEDAALLQKHSNAEQTIRNINPIAYKEPIAPHIAANSKGESITIEALVEHYSVIEQTKPGFILTEGAGGWRLPLGNGKFLSALPKVTNQGIVLVVNMKLGCLNHAMLTYEAIINDGLTCVGWVANYHEEMNYLSENIAELRTLIKAPLLGCVGWVETVEQAAQYLDTSPLFKSR